jgi:hypothetical protein
MEGPMRSIGELFSPSAVDGLPQADPRRQALDTALAWLRSYLAEHDPDVGRDGPVCPFVPLGLTRDTLWLVVEAVVSPDDVASAMLAYLEEFEKRTAGFGAAMSSASIIVVFPGIGPADAPLAIDAVQRRLKVQFVERGYMIGEFHAANTTPAVSATATPGALPNRSPISMLAIRALVRNDKKFLSGEDFSSPDRLRLKRGFIQSQARAATNAAWRDTLEWVIAELDGLIEEFEAG